MSCNDHLQDQDYSSDSRSSQLEFEDIEGLIVKQQEQLEKEQALERGEALKPASLSGVASIPRAREDDDLPRDIISEMFSVGDADIKTKQSAVVPPRLENMGTPGAIRIQGIAGQEEKEEDVHDEENTMNTFDYVSVDLDSRNPGILSDREESIVQAVLIDADGNDDEDNPAHIIVIAEEQTQTTKNRRKLYIGLGLTLIVVVVVVGVAVAVSTTRKGSSSKKSGPTSTPTTIDQRQPTSKLTADAFLEIYRGESMLNNEYVAYDFQTYYLAVEGNGFLEFLNSSDVALTIFAPAGRAFQNKIIMTSDFVTKYVSPSWVGHSRSIFLNFVVVGDTPMYSKDVVNGSVFTTESGSTIIIEGNSTSFAVVTKNISIPINAPIQVPDLIVSNGVIHGLFDFYFPPWFNLTVYDVLLTANITRNGDLSILIGLVEASTSLKNLLQTNRGPLTFFAPVNKAFSGISLGLVNDSIANGLFNDSALFKVLMNHMSTANYVAAFRAWEQIPEGIKTGTDQFTLTSLFGEYLTVTAVDNVTSTINSNASVLEFDVLSEFGVVQIIDTLLMIPGIDL